MQDEAAIREEIQETTGVSSRGFLIPKRDVREDVLGMLSAGNQRGRTPSGDDGEDVRNSRCGCCCLDGGSSVSSAVHATEALRRISGSTCDFEVHRRCG